MEHDPPFTPWWGEGGFGRVGVWGGCAQCLHTYGTNTVVCHGFQNLCVHVPCLENSNMSGLEHTSLLLGMIYFTVPPKATTPPSGSRPHCSIYLLYPYEDSGETQLARLKQVAERRRWHAVTDSPQARADDFETNSFKNMLLIKKIVRQINTNKYRFLLTSTVTFLKTSKS